MILLCVEYFSLLQLSHPSDRERVSPGEANASTAFIPQEPLVFDAIMSSSPATTAIHTPEPAVQIETGAALASLSEDETLSGMDDTTLYKDLDHDEPDFLTLPKTPPTELQLANGEERRAVISQSLSQLSPVNSLSLPNLKTPRVQLRSISPLAHSEPVDDVLRRSVSPTTSIISLVSSSPLSIQPSLSLHPTETPNASSSRLQSPPLDNNPPHLISPDRDTFNLAAHGRYSLRTRQAKQVNPYAYDKQLYKRQMRSNPDALVKVVSPLRPKRHGHREHGERDGSGEEGDEEYEEEEARSEARQRRKEKSRSRSANAMEPESRLRPDDRAGGDRARTANVSSWEPAIFRETSSSSDGSDGDDLLLKVPQTGEEPQDRRLKRRPFPLRQRRTVPAGADRAQAVWVSLSLASCL